MVQYVVCSTLGQSLDLQFPCLTLVFFLSFSGPDNQPPSPSSPALTKTKSILSPPAPHSARSSFPAPCSSIPAPSRRTRRNRTRRPAPAHYTIQPPKVTTCPLRSPPARVQMTLQNHSPVHPPNNRRRPQNRLLSFRTLKSVKRAELVSAVPRHIAPLPPLPSI